MTLNHNDALARVTVDGLAVVCFNARETKWDLAFLRLPASTCHKLLLTVEGEPELYLNESVGVVSFETVNGFFPGGFPLGFFDNGPVNRMVPPAAGAETENFRWVIDLEDNNDVPHGFVGLKQPPLNIGLTRAFIQNAVFYTLGVSAQHLILVPDHVNPNPPMPNPPRIGRTNDEISADIFCNPGGELLIRIDGQVRFRKPHRPGNPWKICFTNLCIESPEPGPPFRKGDFQNFYEVIQISGTRHALWGEPLIFGQAQCFPGADPLDPDKVVPPEFLLGRPDCDTTRLGTAQTLDGLFS